MPPNSKAKYSANVDSEVIVHLTEILRDLNIGNNAVENTQPDLTKITQFLEKTLNISSLVQVFSYCATVNDHSGLSDVATKLTKLIRFLNNQPSLHQPCNILIQELISPFNIKVFYRCLNNSRPSLTNPALRLLSSILMFKEGALVETFIENFDLTLKVLPQLMVPTKAEIEEPSRCKTRNSIRYNFVHFWIDLCQYASPLARKDLLLNNRKIVTNWFKHVSTHDNLDLLESTITFIDEKMIMEDSYKKMTKCQIIGDLVLKRLVELYRVSDIKISLHKLLLKINTDYENGLVFADDKLTWLSGQAEASSASGVPVVIGEQTFRIHNKLIYNLLTNLKPWADSKQLELVVATLSAVPELVPCYNYHYFHSVGAYDPKLTSFFVGESLLLTEMTRLPIPDTVERFVKAQAKNQEGTSVLKSSNIISASALVELVCSVSLKRSSFSKCFTTDCQIIRHIGSQLLISVLQKLHQVLKLLSFNENNFFSQTKNELLEIVINHRLPDASVVVGALNECNRKTPDNKLLLINFLEICELFGSVLSQQTPVSLPTLNLGQQPDDFKSIDLVILDLYLQANADSQQNKWWNVVSGSKNSLFTMLLRLPYRLKLRNFDIERISSKVVDVVCRLIDGNLTFNNFKSSDNSIVNSQAYALVYALNHYSERYSSEEDIDVVCRIIDESISRSVKSPYKFIDAERGIVGKDGLSLSAFYVAVVEQSTFAQKEYSEKVLFWLSLFSRYLSLVGEPVHSMQKVVSKYWPSQSVLKYLENFENHIPEFYEYLYSGAINSKLLPFAEYVLNSPLQQLKTGFGDRFPMSDIDFIALVRRCTFIVEDSTIKLEDVEELLVEILSKIGNYLIQKMRISEGEVSNTNLPLMKKKYWQGLYLSVNDLMGKKLISFTKKCFVSGLLNEIFHSLSELKDEEHENLSQQWLEDYSCQVSSLLELKDSPPAAQNVLYESLWALNNDSIIQQLRLADPVSGKLIRTAAMDLLVSKVIKLEPEFLLELSNSVTKEEQGRFRRLCENAIFGLDHVEKLLHKAVDEPAPQLYESLSTIVSSQPELIASLAAQVLPQYEIMTSSPEGLDFVVHLATEGSPSELLELIYQTSANGLKKVVESGSLADVPVKSYLRCLAKAPEHIQSELKNLMEMDGFKNRADLIFSTEVADILSSTETNSTTLKSWLHRGTLYITKVLAEHEVLPNGFVEFLMSLKKVFSNLSVWSVVPSTLLNSQLEVIFSKNWIKNEFILQYVSWLLATGSKQSVAAVRNIQILLNNEWNILNELPTASSLKIRFYTALILHYLFQFDPKKTSSFETQSKILKFYTGSIRADDLVLKRLLLVHEKILNKSWIHLVTDWDLVEDEATSSYSSDARLIISTAASSPGLTVSLSKRFIKNTIDNFYGSAESTALPELTNGAKAAVKWDEFFVHNSIVLNRDSYSYSNTIYDVEFLLLLIINNDELFKFNDGTMTADVKKLVESDLLQLVVMNLSAIEDETKPICRQILCCCLDTLETELKEITKLKESKDQPPPSSLHLFSYKDRLTFKVYIANLLNTLRATEEPVAPVLLIFLSYLIPILRNPGHMLYEKAYRYLLGGSKFRVWELPLFKAICTNFTADPHLTKSGSAPSFDEDHYKELSWFFSSLRKSIKHSSDLKIINKNHVVEYLLTLTGSPFLNLKLQSEIVGVLLAIAELPNGADMLIRSSGLMGYLELQKSKLDKTITTVKSGKDKLVADLNLLNWQRLAAKTEIAAECNGHDKRAREWTDEDLDRSVKRVLLP